MCITRKWKLGLDCFCRAGAFGDPAVGMWLVEDGGTQVEQKMFPLEYFLRLFAACRRSWLGPARVAGRGGESGYRRSHFDSTALDAALPRKVCAQGYDG